MYAFPFWFFIDSYYIYLKLAVFVKFFQATRTLQRFFGVVLMA